MMLHVDGLESAESSALETAVAVATAYIITHRGPNSRSRTPIRAHALSLVARACGGFSWAEILSFSGNTGRWARTRYRAETTGMTSMQSWSEFVVWQLVRVRNALTRLLALAATEQGGGALGGGSSVASLHAPAEAQREHVLEVVVVDEVDDVEDDDVSAGDVAVDAGLAEVGEVEDLPQMQALVVVDAEDDVEDVEDVEDDNIGVRVVDNIGVVNLTFIKDKRYQFAYAKRLHLACDTAERMAVQVGSSG